MKKIESILSKMTLEEKVAQLLQIPANGSKEAVERFKNMGTLGSFFARFGQGYAGVYCAFAKNG